MINKHHRLQKQLAKAERDCEFTEVTRLKEEIAKNGGLEHYQSASIIGQSNSRGGDSSSVLVDWLKPDLEHTQLAAKKLRVLEVGALSIDNAISKVQNVEMTRIDLNSQHPQIKKQDFMTMAIPLDIANQFDIVSLSLVVNYVPDAEGRGDMLRRVSSFLRPFSASEAVQGADQPSQLPVIFLVLPAPCVTNSRYLSEQRLGEIMTNLGYSLLQRKISTKLVYYLWRLDGAPVRSAAVPKKKVNDGQTRNNFCIVLR